MVAIDAHQSPGRADLPYRIRTFDETGFLFLVWFKGGGAHLARRHPVGARRAVSGRVDRRYRDELQMAHPDYLLPADQVDEIPEFEAIYPATAGLHARTVRRWRWRRWSARRRCPSGRTPPGWRASGGRAGAKRWRRCMHRAPRPTVEPGAPARRRLAYDELFAHQLALAQRKADRKSRARAGVRPAP